MTSLNSINIITKSEFRHLESLVFSKWRKLTDFLEDNKKTAAILQRLVNFTF